MRRDLAKSVHHTFEAEVRGCNSDHTAPRLVAAEHGDDGLGPIGQKPCDAVTGLDRRARLQERVSELRWTCLEQLLEGGGCWGAVELSFATEGDAQ